MWMGPCYALRVCLQKLNHRGWKDLWPDGDLHKQCRDLLGNLALLPDYVNESLNSVGLMEDMMVKYKAGTVHFLSTNELTHKDWEMEDLLARHAKMISAIALRLDLPTQRLDRHLPKLSMNARGDQKLENFKKWQ